MLNLKHSLYLYLEAKGVLARVAAGGQQKSGMMECKGVGYVMYRKPSSSLCSS